MSRESGLRRRLLSFVHAGRGIATMIRSERNAQFHVLATIVVVAVGLHFEIERGEWLALALAVGVVFCAEAFNTAFEALCDVVSPEHHPGIGRAKDLAAGAVLLAALAALAVGIGVFGRRLIGIFGP